MGVAMGMARILTIRAYAAAPPEQLAPFNYAVVVFSALIGRAISHEVPNWLTGLGIVLVTLGGILSTYHRRAASTAVPTHGVGPAVARGSSRASE
jgi:drug/metabolite transporter (DMT)-like permease